MNARERRIGLAQGGLPCEVHVQVYGVEEVDLVPLARKPAGIGTRPSSCIDDARWSRGEVVIENLLGSGELQLARAGLEPASFVARLGIVLVGFGGKPGDV